MIKNTAVGFRWIIAPVTLVSVLLGFTGCTGEVHKEEAPKLKVTSPLRSDQDITREYVAQIHAIQHIEVRAFERGYLQKIYVDEGQLVKKGERMFEIMPTMNQAEFDKSRAEVKLASIEYKNTKNLWEKNVVSKNELMLTKAKLDKAKAEMDLKQVHLNMNTVKAPFDGIMDRFHVRLGSLINEDELLTTLSDNSQMWVYFNVSEADYLNLKSQRGDFKSIPVKLRMANDEMFSQEGRVETVEADFNNETGNIAFRALFSNPDRLLRHGETGNVQITIPIKNALVIPQKATFEILDKKFVYILDSKNNVVSREIQVQAEIPHLYVISKGLAEGDKILIDGIAKVHPGQKITPEFEAPKEVFSKLDVPAE